MSQMSLAQQILSALETAASPVQAARQQGEIQLAQLKTDAVAFFSACAEIFVSPSASMYGRQLCGFQIKNSLLQPSCAGNANLQGGVCTQAIVDPQRAIRKVASSIISLAVRENVWPPEGVVQNMCTILSGHSQELPAVHGAMLALSQIVDDCVMLLEARQMIPQIVQSVQPYLTATHLGTHGDALEVRAKALDVMTTLLERAGMDFDSYAYRTLRGFILPLMQTFFSNLENPLSNTIAAKCVACLVLSLTFYDQISDDLFGRLLQLMFQVTTSNTGSEEQLRIEATEFWRAILHFPHFAELAEPAIEPLIPVLIKAMVYSEMEMGMLQASASDWNVPDKMDDIRPRQYQARVQNTNRDDGDDDDDDGDNEVEEWNLRRVSALTLDSISEFFGERVLIPVLRVIDHMMQPSEPWPNLEAAVLALGAICDGCFDSLSPYLASITNRLLELLAADNTHFLVINIILWTGTQIGRYLVQEPACLLRFMRSVLSKMQSPSKLTQESATAALQTMAELCKEGQLDSITDEIVSCVAQCLRVYQLKNRVLLLEMLQTLCECMGAALAKSPSAVQELLAPLGEIWATTPNDSPLIFSFFKCMASVCMALGPLMQPMAKDIFGRAYDMLSYHVRLRVAATQAQCDPLEPEFLITSADLLSGLFDALGSSLEPLLANQQPVFMQTLLILLGDVSPEIRQSSFALLGDVAKSCPTHVQVVLDGVCSAALATIQSPSESTYATISNVAWALCNLIENQIELDNLPTLTNATALPQLYLGLAQVFCSADVSADKRNMAENIALCLGMMLYMEPELETRVGCSVSVIAKHFCEHVRNMKPLRHKTLAVNGFLLAVQRGSVEVVLKDLKLFIDLACSLVSEMSDIQYGMKQILVQAQVVNANAWQQALSICDQQTRTTLFEIYALN